MCNINLTLNLCIYIYVECMCPTTESTLFVLLTTFCFEYFSAVILRAANMEISPETEPFFYFSSYFSKFFFFFFSSQLYIKVLAIFISLFESFPTWCCLWPPSFHVVRSAATARVGKEIHELEYKVLMEFYEGMP